MLVTFTCKSHADITMFGDVAKQLLRMMGHSGTVPGAIRSEDIPEALMHLKAAIEKELEKEQDAPPADNDNQKVGLSRRALPLIELLTDAVENKAIVMWE